MKVLYLTPGCFDKGGISRYSRYQISALRELLGGDQVRVLSLLGPDSTSFEETFKADWYGGMDSFFTRVSFVVQIVIQAFLWRPQVIHVAHVNFSGIAWILGRLCNADIVLNVYGREVRTALRKDALSGLRNSRFVISDCHVTADYLIDRKLCTQERMHVVWDCADLNVFYPAMPDSQVLAKYGIPDPERYQNIMTLGRLVPEVAYKGYERLIRTFARIADDYPNAMLIIGGKGTLTGFLESVAEELHISSRVIFTGMIADPDLPDCYRTSYLFSLVTESGVNMGEGIPLTPLEAMACGSPILVGDQDGSKEAVEEGVNGFVIKSTNPDDQINAMKKILDDRMLQKSLSEGAISIARKKFSYPSFVEKHRKLYNDYYGLDGVNFDSSS